MEDVYTFTVNGCQVSTSEKKPLLRFLRDDLHLTSVKDGCSQGACGTCTIVVDGKAQKACVLNTAKAEGKTIVTCEGLTDAEKDAFVYAFGAKGAVQCGFCTPGMVMAAKALIDGNPDPSEDDVKKAIKNNICRCTGYKKIIEAIQLAAAVLRGEAPVDEALENGADGFGVGDLAFRLDVREKVLGYGQYPDDIYEEGMVHASALRTPHPRARVVSIDTSDALEVPGVLAVLTAEDVPVNKVGHLQQDWDVMIAEGDVTRCVGDAVALVVAENERALEEGRRAVRVEYEVLEPVRNVHEAAAEGAPAIHEGGNLCQQRHITRGDAKAALAEAAHTVTESFTTPFTEHAFLEPECAVAWPTEGGVRIVTTDQGVFDTRKEVAHRFGWDDEPERVVVENALVGGGFGGKEDVSVQHLAALAARAVGRPVKAKLTRDESIRFHPKRHAMEATFTVGCDADGVLVGLDCDVYFDTGAYASLCGPVLERACTHAPGPYCYQNTDIRGYGYYTNNPPAGAFRGFGVCQTEYALEVCLDLLAEKVGISPWEIRYRNAIEPGKVLPNGQIADCSTALKETLEAVRDVYEANADHAGVACAMKNAGVGVGLPDKGRARIVVRDGVACVYCAASDIGQGCKTVFAQMACEASGLPLDKVRMMPVSSELGPDSGTTSGSRQTLISGEAVRMVAADLRADLDAAGGDLAALEGREYYEEFFDPTDKLGADVPYPKSHVAYGFATSVAILDEEGYVDQIWQAHDSGKVVNPIAIQGQIEGGVLMSMGYGLTEDFPLKDCVPTAKYGTLGLLRADRIPDIHAIYVEKDELLPFAYGAKGIGEISSIPTAQAIAGAYMARDGKVRNKLPMEDTPYARKPKKAAKMTPEQIAAAMAAKKAAKKAE